MLVRMLLVIALALVVGFGVAKVFEQVQNPQIAAESGEDLDAALNGGPDLTNAERWYDHPSTIGAMAGGIVFVIGVVVAVIVKPTIDERPTRRA